MKVLYLLLTRKTDFHEARILVWGLGGRGGGGSLGRQIIKGEEIL